MYMPRQAGDNNVAHSRGFCLLILNISFTDCRQKNPLKYCLPLFWFCFILFLSTACTKEPAEKPLPVDFGREHTCKVCSMIIVDFPGAKAQIHYKKGKYDSFCSTLDMFLFHLQPDRPADISAIYVNDMANGDAENPVDRWIDATKAFYVYGGDVMGPMGEALVPFEERKDAEAYLKQNGGRIVRFSDITMDMLRPQ